MSKSIEQLADLMATKAADHYRFSPATRKEVARTALMDVLRDLVPLLPLLKQVHEDGACSQTERAHLGELLDTLER